MCGFLRCIPAVHPLSKSVDGKWNLNPACSCDGGKKKLQAREVPITRPRVDSCPLSRVTPTALSRLIFLVQAPASNGGAHCTHSLCKVVPRGECPHFKFCALCSILR